MIQTESQFQHQASLIRVMPGDHTWERIEAKLLAHRGRRKLLHARLLNIAAAVAMLIIVSLSIFFYAQNQRILDIQSYAMSVEELAIPSASEESIFDVNRIRKSYADLKK